jgi:hypothetical protein
VAHAASAGLGRKLRSLESSTGVSVRFLAAQELANLREAVVGPAPLAPLLDGLLAAPAIVQKGFAAEVARDYRRRQGAHTVLVQALMPGRPVALATPSWPGDEKQHEAEARQIDAPKRLPLGEGGG